MPTRMSAARRALLVAAALWPCALAAQEGLGGAACSVAPAAAPALAPRRVALAATDEAPRIDGRLDEAAWARADVVTDLRQQDPREGAPGCDPTEVRLLVDGRTLYIGLRALDREPARINARELRRDADFRNDDKVEILLDTFGDRRGAFRFAVNPLGTQQDALVTDDGRNVNLQWDGAWVSAATIDSLGWHAELAIPLSTLRFRDGAGTWGLNVARIIRRRNEEQLWTAFQRGLGLERVSQAGELTGTDGVRWRRLVEVKPYGSSVARTGVPAPGSTALAGSPSGSAGIEVARLGVTPSLTLEGTANPDFGQAEVDQQIINFTRFSIFFPERRDFFLENADYFSFGNPGTTQLFFSRRIGLTGGAQPVGLDYGAKLTGRVGATSVGLLQAQARAAGPDTGSLRLPRRTFTVGRAKQDLGRRSYLGAMVTRQGGEAGVPGFLGGGVDAYVQPNSFWQVAGYWMRAQVEEGPVAARDAWRVQSNYETDRWRVVGVVEDIGRDFRPVTGFAQRTGFRQYFGQLAFKPRPRGGPIRQFDLETQLEVFLNPAQALETRQAEATVVANFQSSARLFVRGMEWVTDVPTEAFTIAGIAIPAGRYAFNRPQVRITTNRSRRLVADARVKWGGFYGGTREELQGTLTWRPSANLLVDGTYAYNRLRLPGGEADTHLLTGRLDLNLSRAVLSSVLLQVNSAAEVAVVNARVRLNYRPFSDLFLVYTQTTGAALERPSRQLQLKATYDLVL